MRRIIQLTLMGIGNIPGYGTHPGSPVMGLLTVMAIVAGVGAGPWWRGLVAAAVLWLTLGMIYLTSAYQRAEEYVRKHRCACHEPPHEPWCDVHIGPEPDGDAPYDCNCREEQS